MIFKTVYLYKMPTQHENTILIKRKAFELGFSACGIAKAQKLKNEELRLKDYLENNYHGKMSYMANHFEKRLDPTLLVESAKSVVVVLLNYFPAQFQTDKLAPIISKYAYGTDYHVVIKEKLNQLLCFINNELTPVNGRVFTDSAPILEQAWGVRAGLGWIGKNGLLLNKELGSFFFIGELIIDLPLNYDNPYIKEHCGTCNQCLSACPTKALVKPYTLDARKCISYLTIELKDQIPEEFHHQLKGRAFGCDICQDMCPWNRKLKPHSIKAFLPNNQLLTMSANDWKNLSEEQFDALFSNSAIKRSGFKKLKQNIEIGCKKPT